VAKLQAPYWSSSTAHDVDWMAATHASRLAEVMPTPGRASASAHSVSKRDWTRAISLGGGSRVPGQAPLKAALK